MSEQKVKWLAWAIAFSAILLVAVSAVFVYLNRGPQYAYWGSGPGFSIPYAIVGALILSRLPRHRIGWLSCASSIWALDAFAGAYGAYALAEQPALPLGVWLAWLSRWLWMPGALCVILIALLFPSGQPLSPRWNLAIWITTVGNVLMCIAAALFPGQPSTPNIGISFDNPVSLAGAESLLTALNNVGMPLFNVGLPAAIISLILRLHRARGQERQQLKWFVFAAAVSLPLFPLAGPLGLTATAFGIVVVGTAIPSLMPVAAGIAILRYRLYDIDIIIRRTLIYGVLTAALALVYFASVILMQELFRTVTRQRSELAIILSTLAIAALFNPLRRRVQDAIDRRFYRRRYDAAKVIAAFSATVRDEVDLNKLSDRLLEVVEETMQPAHVSLWLKATADRRRLTTDGMGK